MWRMLAMVYVYVPRELQFVKQSVKAIVHSRPLLYHRKCIMSVLNITYSSNSLVVT